jgi:hypothetical protein
LTRPWLPDQRGRDDEGAQRRGHPVATGSARFAVVVMVVLVESLVVMARRHLRLEGYRFCDGCLSEGQ